MTIRRRGIRRVAGPSLLLSVEAYAWRASAYRRLDRSDQRRTKLRLRDKETTK